MCIRDSNKDIILDQRGEWREWMGARYSGLSAVVTPHGGSSVVAHVHFRVLSWPIDVAGGRIWVHPATGARADGRSVNRISYATQGFSRYQECRVTLSGGARVVGHPGNVVILRLGMGSATNSREGYVAIDVVHSKAEPIKLTLQLINAGTSIGASWVQRTIRFT